MPESTKGPTMLRVLLGTQLRRLRESRGSARRRRPGDPWIASKISRIELGRNAVREIDVLNLLTYYGVGAVEREQLLGLAEEANRPGWWHRYNDILPDWFQSYVGMEEAATSIRIYEPQFIPGLLQTHQYAAAVLALGDVPISKAERHASSAGNGGGGSPKDGSSCGPWSRKPRCAGRWGAKRSCATSSVTCSASAAGRPHAAVTPLGMEATPRRAGSASCGSARRTCPTSLSGNLTSASTSTKSDVDRYLLAIERLSVVSAKPSETPETPARSSISWRQYMSVRNGMPASELPKVTWRKSRRSGPQGATASRSDLPTARSRSATPGSPPDQPWCYAPRMGRLRRRKEPRTATSTKCGGRFFFFFFFI